MKFTSFCAFLFERDMPCCYQSVPTGTGDWHRCLWVPTKSFMRKALHPPLRPLEMPIYKGIEAWWGCLQPSTTPHHPSTNLACSANQFDGYRLRNETFHGQLPTCNRLFGLKDSNVSYLSLWHIKILLVWSKSRFFQDYLDDSEILCIFAAWKEKPSRATMCGTVAWLRKQRWWAIRPCRLVSFTQT